MYDTHPNPTHDANMRLLRHAMEDRGYIADYSRSTLAFASEPEDSCFPSITGTVRVDFDTRTARVKSEPGINAFVRFSHTDTLVDSIINLIDNA